MFFLEEVHLKKQYISYKTFTQVSWYNSINFCNIIFFTIHVFITIILIGNFRQYDYGTIQNKRKYGQFTPPDYDMANITAPVALFYSEGDLFASVTVSIILSNKIHIYLENDLIRISIFRKYFNLRTNRNN